MNAQADDARAIALDLLAAVLRKKRPLDEALANHRRFARLSPQDRAFARQLVSTVLRRLGEIDAVLKRLVERPLKGGARSAHDVLRLGAAQLLFMNTPAHAAVSTSVDLAARRGHGHLKGLVNGVLRRLDRERGEPAATADAARLDTPDWLWDAWADAYGAETTSKIAEAHLIEPPLHITTKAGDPEFWAEHLGAEILPTGSLCRRQGGDVTALPGFDEGAWWVQDAAAALPARLLGDVAGKRAVDLCAAPGGKTLQLAAAGARVTAIDRSGPRLKRLRQNLSRTGLEAETIQATVGTWRPTDGELADAVLLDAPCSATGTLRRHPDVARLKSAADVTALAAAQARLLAAAAELTAPGGILVYCVCSLQPQEGSAIVEGFLSAGDQFERHAVGHQELAGLEAAVTPAGDLRTLPCHWPEAGGVDGFYAARLRRRG